MEFFIPMVPPTITHQEKKVNVVNGKPIFYEPEKLKTARQKLMAYLGYHVPEEPFHTGVQLVTKWCFPRGRHKDGDWDDDALVASEVVEKFWAEIPGIYIKVTEL